MKKRIKKIKNEIDEKKAEIMEEIISGRAKLIDLTPFETNDYIKCQGTQIEVIGGRTRIAFVRCPKCHNFIGLYEDEMPDEGKCRPRRCVCGFQKELILKNWKKK